MTCIEILLKSKKAKRKVGNHSKIERNGSVNYLYFKKPILIINRKRKEIIINDWNRVDKGVNRAIECYLNSHTVKYIVRYMNYNLIDLRGRANVKRY